MIPYSASKGKVIRAINAGDTIVGEGFSQSGRTIASVDQGITTPPINAIGIITNTGPYGSEPDYKGCDYWVQILQNFTSSPYNNEKDGPLLLGQSASTVDTQQNPVDLVITAHNPSEYAANTHNIALNTIVELLPIYIDRPTDLQSTQFIRWVIVSASPGGSGASVQVTAVNSPLGNYSGNVVTFNTSASILTAAGGGYTIGGITAGAACTIYLGEELAVPSPSGNPYISATNSPVFPATLICPANGSNPAIYVISGPMIGCTSNSSGGSTATTSPDFMGV